MVDLEEDYNCTDNYNASMLYSDDIWECTIESFKYLNCDTTTFSYAEDNQIWEIKDENKLENRKEYPYHAVISSVYD